MARRPSVGAKQADVFRTFLEGFGSAYALASAAEAAEAETTVRLLPEFFRGYHEALERWRHQQEDSADDFNILEVLRLTGNEIRHSMLLAWLLDWDMTALGTHAQGNLGFRFFLEEFAMPAWYAEGKYRVQREVSADDSTIDVEVAERRRFVVHIENKIWSGEGDDETNREWQDLQKRAEHLECPESCHAFYLTPDGTKPRSANFRPISWRHVAKILDRFAAAAKPTDVSLFARHYANALRTHITPELDEKENDDACKQVQ